MPDDYTPTDDLRAWAAIECPNADFERELAKIRDHEFRTARSDWTATFRNWLRRANDQTRNTGPGSGPNRESKFQRMRRRANEVTE
jgi:hypothetical protein